MHDQDFINIAVYERKATRMIRVLDTFRTELWNFEARLDKNQNIAELPNEYRA